MMYFFCAFRTELMLRLRSRGTRVVSLLAAILSIWMILSPGGPIHRAVQVGVVLPRRGGEELISLLQQRSGGVVEFVIAEEQMLDRKILSGEWDCGLILAEDFDKSVEELELRRLITIRTGPSSTVYPIVQEAVSSCIMELISPFIARDYLESIGLDPKLLEPQLQQWDNEDGWVSVQMETLGGDALQPLELVKSAKVRIFTGLLAIFSLAWAMYLTVDMGRRLGSTAALRLASLRAVTQLLLPKLVASMFPVFLWGLVFLVLLGNAKEAWTGYLAFTILLTGIGLVVSRFPVLWQSLIAAMPFLVVSSLLLEPVLLDIRILFPTLSRFTGLLPVTLLLNTCNGNVLSLGILLLEGVFFLLVSALLDRL